MSISRRDILKKAGLAAGSLAAAAGVAGCSSSKSEADPKATTGEPAAPAPTPAVPCPPASTAAGSTDVLIIGGGFAGLTAARELRHAGFHPILLEARHRLGGRTWTGEWADWGISVEWGGQYIHWTQPHVWSEMRRYGLEISETRVPSSSWRTAWVTTGGRLWDGNAEKFSILMVEAMTRFTQAAQENEIFRRPFVPLETRGLEAWDGMSIEDYFDSIALPRDQEDVLASLLTTLGSARNADISLAQMLKWMAICGWNVAMFQDATSRYTFKGGSKLLMEAIAADGRPELHLSTQVKSIEQKDDRVVVKTLQGTEFSAPVAVVALPLNILAEIEFSPALPENKMAASRQRHAGAGVKVWILVENAGALPDLVGVSRDPAPLTWLVSADKIKDALLLIGFGPDAKLVNVHDKKDVKRALAPMLPKAKVIDVAGHDWVADPYSKGTWTTFRPKQLSKYFLDLQKPAGRLHFAGTYTANGWNSFIDGAIESGMRAARDVIRAMQG